MAAEVCLATAGDYLHGFPQATRQALFENECLSMTITIRCGREAIALIAYERAPRPVGINVIISPASRP